jgi:hypothetical protein
MLCAMNVYMASWDVDVCIACAVCLGKMYTRVSTVCVAFICSVCILPPCPLIRDLIVYLLAHCVDDAKPDAAALTRMQVEEETLPVKQSPAKPLPPTSSPQPSTKTGVSPLQYHTLSLCPTPLAVQGYPRSIRFGHHTPTPTQQQPRSPVAANFQGKASSYVQKISTKSPAKMLRSGKALPLLLPAGFGPWADTDLADSEQPVPPAVATAALLYSDSFLYMPQRASFAPATDPFGGPSPSSSRRMSGYAHQGLRRSSFATSSAYTGGAHAVPGAARVVPWQGQALPHTFPSDKSPMPTRTLAAAEALLPRAGGTGGPCDRGLQPQEGSLACNSSSISTTSSSSSGSVRSATASGDTGDAGADSDGTSSIVGAGQGTQEGKGEGLGSCYAGLVVAHPQLMHVVEVQLKVGQGDDGLSSAEG